MAGVEEGKTRGDGRAAGGAVVNWCRWRRQGRGRRGGRILENDACRRAQHRRRRDRRGWRRSLRRPVLVPEDLFTYAGYAPNLVRFSSNTGCDTDYRLVFSPLINPNYPQTSPLHKYNLFYLLNFYFFPSQYLFSKSLSIEISHCLNNRFALIYSFKKLRWTRGNTHVAESLFRWQICFAQKHDRRHVCS